MESSDLTTTFGVAELLTRAGSAVAGVFPGPVWVRGEVSGLRRTPNGAVFFRLVDTESNDLSLEIAARGLVMREVDLALDRAGVGSLREGVEVRVSGTVGVSRRGAVQLSLLDIDPAFTLGRMALTREEVLRRLAADGTLDLNKTRPIPLVPLRVGLVTSRGSAAHADFLDQLRRSGRRFRVLTVHASMQGERAPAGIVEALDRLSAQAVDVVAVVRGGGSKLDLAAFDNEEVARAIARMPMPVVVGIGHEIDRSVVDEVAAISVKTPTAAGEWLVTRVEDFAGRIDRARAAISDQALRAFQRSESMLASLASGVAGARHAVAGQRERLDRLAEDVADRARAYLQNKGRELDRLGDTLAVLGVEPTLRRGFAVVTRLDGSAVTRAGQLKAGESVSVRFADGSVPMRVETE